MRELPERKRRDIGVTSEGPSCATMCTAKGEGGELKIHYLIVFQVFDSSWRRPPVDGSTQLGYQNLRSTTLICPRTVYTLHFNEGPSLETTISPLLNFDSSLNHCA